MKYKFFKSQTDFYSPSLFSTSSAFTNPIPISIAFLDNGPRCLYNRGRRAASTLEAAQSNRSEHFNLITPRNIVSAADGVATIARGIVDGQSGGPADTINPG